MEQIRDLEAKVQEGAKVDYQPVTERKEDGDLAQGEDGESESQLESLRRTYSKATVPSDDPKQSGDVSYNQLRSEADFFKQLCCQLSEENTRVGTENKNLKGQLKGKDKELEEKTRLLDTLRNSPHKIAMLQKR